MLERLLFMLVLPMILVATPTAPSNLVLTSSTTTVDISWQDNSDDESGFKILRDDNLIYTTKADETHYKDTGLTPSTTYKYTVKATNDMQIIATNYDSKNRTFIMKGRFLPSTRYAFYIDSDNDPNTGYKGSIAQIKGADYMIQGTHGAIVYQYPPNQTGWRWKKIGTTGVTKTNSNISVSLPQDLIPITNSFSFIASAALSSDAQTIVYSKAQQIGERTLYVDKKNGPYKTISQAVSEAKAGDRIFIKAGIYFENIKLPRSGTKEKPIIIEGEKDENGKLLTTIFGGKRVKAHWVEAKEIGKGVYKTTDIPFETYAMTIYKDGKFRDIPKLDSVLTKSKQYLEGDSSYKGQVYGFKDVLALPKDKVVSNIFTHIKVKYWDGIGAVYAYKDETTYIRFADYLDPNKLELYANAGVRNSYPNFQKSGEIHEGAVITIHNKSHIIIKNLIIDGAQNGVLIYGKDAHDNIIDSNDIRNGQRRVSITQYAHHNIIKNNKLHMVLYDERFRPGAWYFTDNKNNHRIRDSLPQDLLYRFGVAAHIYNAYKREIGYQTFSPLDDCGVFINGAGGDNRVTTNEIYDTLGGVLGAAEGDVYIDHNLFHHISSSVTGTTAYGVNRFFIYKNNFYNVALALRVQLYSPNENDLPHLAKKVWFFENKIYNPTEVGSGFFFARRSSDLVPPKEYMPKVYIYNNIYHGNGVDHNNITNVNRDILVLNNIFSAMRPRFDEGVEPVGLQYNTSQKLWSFDDESYPKHMPKLKTDINYKKIDLSKPFTIGGREFGPLVLY